MQKTERSAQALLAAGYLLAPLQANVTLPCVQTCVLVRTEPDEVNGPFVLLREAPLAQVYLGALCDVGGRIHEWLEVWVQSVEPKTAAPSGNHERLPNFELDQRWASECNLEILNNPDSAIITGLETVHGQPLLITSPRGPEAVFAVVENSGWELCRDDVLLNSFGLEAYQTGSFRYLHKPNSGPVETFLATSEDWPVNSHVEGLDRLKSAEVLAVFNPRAGLIRVKRFCPLGLEEYLQVLEGRAWDGAGPGTLRLFEEGIYGLLQTWSGKPKGLPFLVHGAGTLTDRRNEIFFLKASVLLGMFRAVREYAAFRQSPLLNLSPSSFAVSVPEVGEQLPALWGARCALSKPGQAHPLTIKSTQHRYFVRLGRIEPSIYLPEGLGAHSFGTGSVRKRDVRSEAEGFVLEGTLVAQDYLGVDPHDLLWFRLPVAGQQRLEFYAHVYKGDSLGPKEARFRTVPTKLDDSVVAVLKSSGVFARAPYEIWPLLSSPCDLYSLAVISVRALLANSQSNMTIILDDMLGLSRRVGKDLDKSTDFTTRLKEILNSDKSLLDLVSPQRLVDENGTPAEARAAIHLDLWIETVAWVLRLFPGLGPHSFCRDFGDVSSLALETVFDRPIDELETLLIRLRSVILPTSATNAEIADVIRERLLKEG
jgi:hypothetical protein